MRFGSVVKKVEQFLNRELTTPEHQVLFSICAPTDLKEDCARMHANVDRMTEERISQKVKVLEQELTSLKGEQK